MPELPGNVYVGPAPPMEVPGSNKPLLLFNLAGEIPLLVHRVGLIPDNATLAIQKDLNVVRSREMQVENVLVNPLRELVLNGNIW